MTRIAVLSFPGNNCEVESLKAVKQAGMEAVIVTDPMQVLPVLKAKVMSVSPMPCPKAPTAPMMFR